MASNRERFTMVFEGDLRAFGLNPLETDTPFGRPYCVGYGSAFEERDALEEQLSRLRDENDSANQIARLTAELAAATKRAEEDRAEKECARHERDVAWEGLKALKVKLAAMRERAEAAEAFIGREGYQKCDIAACNCESWHGGSWKRRYGEVAAELRLLQAKSMELQRFKWNDEALRQQTEKADELEDANARLWGVVNAAIEFRDKGTFLTVCSRGACQQVREKKDKSDPQAKLYAALAALTPSDSPALQGEGQS